MTDWKTLEPEPKNAIAIFDTPDDPITVPLDLNELFSGFIASIPPGTVIQGIRIELVTPTQYTQP